MSASNRTLNILSPIILVFSFTQTTQATSVYVVSNTETSELQAYKVEDTNLVHQPDANYVCQSDPPTAAGAVGIAVDESGFLFVTFESSNIIELVDAETMQYVDTVTATGASSLAGIVVDKGKQKVYVVDRRTNHLYVYSWDPVSKELTLGLTDPYYIELEDSYQGYGLALDEVNNRLYVADNTTAVKYYDTNDPNWSKLGEFTVSHNAISVAVDAANQYLYTGSIGEYGDGDPNLYQYDISAQSENAVTVGSSVGGIAVDQETSLIYLTTFGGQYDQYYPDPPEDRLFVYDVNLAQQWVSDDIGNPAGVAVASGVSYKPPVLTLEKVDVNEPNSVLPGDYITYTITYGPNGIDHNNVVIVDYLPDEVDYPDPFDPNYDMWNHTYTWVIGSLDANAPNDSVTLTVVVNENAEMLGTITNVCTIESDLGYTTATVDTSVGCWGGDVIYVDKSAIGYNTGMSWENAYTDLQSALERANLDCNSGNQIWVAAGTYKPDRDSANPNGSGNPSVSFELINGVAIYGGFAGTETARNQRNWQANETVLSGDLAGDDQPDFVNYSDNSFHVVISSYADASAVIDGFTITAGNSAGTSGGGMYNNNGSPTVANCIFSGNRADYGGGMCNRNSSPTIINCTFNGNQATQDRGGGMYTTIAAIAAAR